MKPLNNGHTWDHPFVLNVLFWRYRVYYYAKILLRGLSSFGSTVWQGLFSFNFHVCSSALADLVG